MISKAQHSYIKAAKDYGYDVFGDGYHYLLTASCSILNTKGNRVTFVRVDSRHLTIWFKRKKPKSQS
ncbi:MAG: hypothetical protein IPN46_18490 [Saprospiraceae bacterium]|nr:hypothetical protein [Saprospiraceae bacterium]